MFLCERNGRKITCESPPFLNNFSIRIAMNRYPIFALAWCISLSVCFAQGAENCIQVISAAGKSGTQAGLTFHYTVGEPVITTLAGNSRKVTQGFHQPELCTLVSTNDLDLAAWGIEVFPNPATDFLTIRFSNDNGSSLNATVFNLFGQVMLSDQRLNKPDGTQLDCSSWQPGVYILQLQDPSTRAATSVRFVRL